MSLLHAKNQRAFIVGQEVRNLWIFLSSFGIAKQQLCKVYVLQSAKCAENTLFSVVAPFGRPYWNNSRIWDLRFSQWCQGRFTSFF